MERAEEIGAGGESDCRRTRLMLWAAGGPLVLVAVLVSHMALRASADLTPWKGGGFGMFSTVDSPGTRQVRAELRGETGRFGVQIPKDLESLVSEVRAAPAEDRVRLLAREVAEQFWVIPRLPSEGASPEEKQFNELAMRAMAELVPVDAVKAISREDFNPATHQRVKVSEVEVSVWRVSAERDDRPDGGGTLRPGVLRAVVVKAEIGKLR